MVAIVVFALWYVALAVNGVRNYLGYGDGTSGAGGSGGGAAGKGAGAINTPVKDEITLNSADPIKDTVPVDGGKPGDATDKEPEANAGIKVAPTSIDGAGKIAGGNTVPSAGPVAGNVPGPGVAPGLGSAPGVGSASGAGNETHISSAPGAGSTPGTVNAPGVRSTPHAGNAPGTATAPGLVGAHTLGSAPDAGSVPGMVSAFGTGSAPGTGSALGAGSTLGAVSSPDAGNAPGVRSTPDIDSAAAIRNAPGAGSTPGVGSVPVIKSTTGSKTMISPANLTGQMQNIDNIVKTQGSEVEARHRVSVDFSASMAERPTESTPVEGRMSEGSGTVHRDSFGKQQVAASGGGFRGRNYSGTENASGVGSGAVAGGSSRGRAGLKQDSPGIKQGADKSASRIPKLSQKPRDKSLDIPVGRKGASGIGLKCDGKELRLAQARGATNKDLVPTPSPQRPLGAPAKRLSATDCLTEVWMKSVREKKNK